MMSQIWKRAAVSAALLTLTLGIGLGGSQIAPPAEAKSTKDAGYAACFDWCASHRGGAERTKCECNCNVYYYKSLAKSMRSCLIARGKA